MSLSLEDKVTIGACNLGYVVINFAESQALDKIQSSIQFNSNWILQLINAISDNLQKLLKYFNGTTNFLQNYLYY